MCCKEGMRFLSLMLWDVRTGAARLWPAGASLAGIYTAYWAVMFLMQAHAEPEDRLAVLFITALIFAFGVPSAVYGYINDPSDGIGRTMLPVKAAVKFTVMLTVSAVIFPLCFYTGLHILDSLLTAAGGGRGFTYLIWETAEGVTFGSFCSDFSRICLYQSVFILGNILLRKHKVTLTVLATLALHGIFMGLLHIDRSSTLYSLYSYAGPLLVWAFAYAAFRRMQFR